ncbi:hypothetical protein [Brachybacterium tyrofermentans]|uniref:hypothetical protein n=1 Tax=Brachybacterium TaxID=43668 RepID=UPI003D24156D
MTRNRWALVGAAALVAMLILVFGLAAPSERPQETDPEHVAATARATQPPDSERLFLPGYDSTPAALELTDPEGGEGGTLTAHLALEDGAVLTGGFVGLSFDARELASPLWGSVDSNLTLTLRELDRPALRFGGNGVDRYMWWTSAGEPAPEWADVTVTPEDLERVAAVADDVDAQVTLDLDLGHDDSLRAADMAAHAQDAFGARLLAVSIGNEPNGFFHTNQPELAVRGDAWTSEAYQTSLAEYSAALEDRVPGVPVAGPGAYDAEWWRAFAESGIPNQRALSLHWYPLWDCEGPAGSIANPSVEDLTSPAIRERAQSIIGMGADIADANSLPLWMEETGPTSCPGTNDTSRTHAQALWTIDYALTAAELGVDRMAFHSTLQACEGGAPMSPLCARGPFSDPGQILEGRSSFLALMQIGTLPDGQVLTPAMTGDGQIALHAVLGDDGRLAIVLVDLRDPSTSGNSTVPVEISAPDGTSAVAPQGWDLTLGSRLSGESLESTRSTLGAPRAVSGDLTGAHLGRAQPLTVPSEPGTATFLHFDAVDDAAPSDGAAE